MGVIDMFNVFRTKEYNSKNTVFKTVEEFYDKKETEYIKELIRDKKVDFFLGSKKYEDWMAESNPFYEIKSLFFDLSKNITEFQKNSRRNFWKLYLLSKW